VRRLGTLVGYAAQGGPEVVAIVGSILSPGTRGGLSSTQSMLTTHLGR